MSNFIELIKWAVPILGTAFAWYTNEHQKRNLHKWEVKKKACLEALQIVDAYYSHQKWNWSGRSIKPEQQAMPKIEEVRNTYNNLCLSCDRVEVLHSYKKCLGIYGEIKGDYMWELRNAIRKELGYGGVIDQDREKAWIATINPLNQP